MKKNAIPELNYKWWNKNKAKTMKTSGLGKALTAFEVAEDKMDWDKAVKALSEVKKKVVVAIGACTEKGHAETIAALKKYPKVIQAKEVELKGKQSDQAERNKSGGAVPKQKIGKDVVVWKRDIGVEALEAEGDLVTPAYMAEDAEKLGQKVIGEVVAELKKFDDVYEKVSKDADVKKVDGLLLKKLGALVDKAKPTFQKLPAVRWI